MTLLQETLREFDDANRLDPRSQKVAGILHPRELVFSQRVSEWINRLSPEASESVRLAARSHTLRRWEVPRDRFAMDTAGYHQWRCATAEHSAREASHILERRGYPNAMVERVASLIKRELFPQDPDAQLLEDADCLVFLEIKLEEYLSQWDEEKVARVLRGTWSKMSESARGLAMDLPVPPEVRKVLEGF